MGCVCVSVSVYVCVYVRGYACVYGAHNLILGVSLCHLPPFKFQLHL